MHGDTEVAEAALRALSETMSTTAADIALAVHDGWLTLSGEVAFWHEKQAAERVVRNIQGVKAVANHIAPKAPHSTLDVKPAAAHTVRPYVPLPADTILVPADGGPVTLESEIAFPP